MARIEETHIAANGLRFKALTAGEGPLVLLLHGFPDHPESWRPIIEIVAERGFRAVAPWMRGYTPGSVPRTPAYYAANLGMDVLAWIEALGYQSAAVVGHDWGALAAYAAALAAPSSAVRIDCLVVMAVPYGTLRKALLCNGAQQKRSWYMYFFSTPMALPAFRHDDYAFADRLWRDWSPGLGPEHAAAVKTTLRAPGVDEAVLSYYQQLYRPAELDESLRSLQQKVGTSPVETPTLYFHGAEDGCIGAECVRGMEDFFPNGFECEIVAGAGHFLQVERAAHLGGRIVDFLSARLRDGDATRSRAPSP